MIWGKEWTTQLSKPLRKGPFALILSTPTAVKLAEIMPGIRHSSLKPAVTDGDGIADSTGPLGLTLRKTSTGRADQKSVGPTLVTLEAGQSMHGRNLRSVTLHQDGHPDSRL